jgi:hypothetical protein
VPASEAVQFVLLSSGFAGLMVNFVAIYKIKHGEEKYTLTPSQCRPLPSGVEYDQQCGRTDWRELIEEAGYPFKYTGVENVRFYSILTFAPPATRPPAGWSCGKRIETWCIKAPPAGGREVGA